MKKLFVALLIGLMLFTTLGLVVAQAGIALHSDTAENPWPDAQNEDTAHTPLQTDTLYLPVFLTGHTTPATEELSPEERAQAIQAIQSRLEALLPAPSTPLDQRNLVEEVELLGQELVELPQVLTTVVQTNTLTVHAILSDGLVVTIINNRPPGADETPPQVSQLRQNITAQLTGQQALPGSNRAVVANFDGGDAVATEVRGLLQEAGYDVLNLGASINAMRNYKNLGALYLDTHGASFLTVTDIINNPDGSISPVLGDSIYALQTSTQVSASAIENLVDDLRSGRVVVAFSQKEDGWQAKLAITEKFISRNWSFDHGVVMIHACFAGSGPFKPGSDCNGSCFPSDDGVFNPTPLRQAMLGAGADAVISFDSYTNAAYARPSILFFFDRLLGADQEKPKDPPLRPFKLAEVWQAMSQENLLTFQKPGYAIFGTGIGGNSVNLTSDLGDSSVSLAPSIKHVDVIDDSAENQGTLEITGQFGEKQGKVELDGQSAAIESWTRNKIVAKTAFSGPGAAGDLIVKAPKDVKSNPVPITEWIGTLKLTLDPNRGSLKAVADIDMRFRADLHAYRETIDGTPQTREVEVYVSPGSEGETRGTGSYNDGDITEHWSGGGQMDVLSKVAVDAFSEANGALNASGQNLSPESAGDFGGLITLDPDANKTRLCLWILGSYDVTYDGLPDSFQFWISLPPEGLVDSSRGLLGCIDTTLRSDYSIPGGNRSWTHPDVGDVFKLEWSDFQPVSPPEDDTPA